MPAYAHLIAELDCPRCGELFTRWVWFQWGYCPGYGPHPDYTYRLGEAIRWMTDPEGVARPWAFFKVPFHLGGRTSGTRQEANVGDPAVTDLVVQDNIQFYWEAEAQRRRCGTCGQPFDGAVVEIRGGVIQRARIYRPGEFDHTVSYYVFEDNGLLKPVPEWSDHRMQFVDKGIPPAPVRPWGEDEWRDLIHGP